jgi:hypothetical protein
MGNFYLTNRFVHKVPKVTVMKIIKRSRPDPIGDGLGIFVWED